MYAIGTIKGWNAARKRRKTHELNHSIHAVLTLLTLGLWLPVWTTVSIRNEQSLRTKMKSSIVDLRSIERLEISPESRRQLARMS